MIRKPKKGVNKGISAQPLIAVDPLLHLFDGHSFFEKKAAKARELLEKVGIPKQFFKKSYS